MIRRAVEAALDAVRGFAVVVGTVVLLTSLAACPAPSQGGFHRPPPTVEVHRP